MLVVVATPLATFAQEADPYSPNGDLVDALITKELIEVEDLEIENPGILSTNPFYFIKQLRRSTWRVFSVSPVKRAEFELNILNEKAAELKRLQEIFPDNNDALLDALNLYEENIYPLNKSLDKLSNLNKKDYDDFLTKLFNTGVKHIKLFDELKEGSEIRVRERLNEAQTQLSGVMAKGILLDGYESFGKRFNNIADKLAGSILKEIKIVEVLDRFQGELPVDSLENQVVAKLKENFILKTEAKLVAEDLRAILPAFLEKLPGDSWRRIKMLDESREYVTTPDLRNDLTLVRQLILDLATQTREISKTDSDNLAEDSTMLLEFLEGRKENLRNSYIKSILASAGFNLEQAEYSMKDGHYIQALGQASSAMASLQNALSQSLFVGENGEENINKELMGLKEFYDLLVSTADDSQLDYQNISELNDLFILAEESLVELSDNADDSLDEVIPALRGVKVLLFQLESSLENAVNNVELKLQKKKAAQPLIKKVFNDNSGDNELKREAAEEFKNER